MAKPLAYNAALSLRRDLNPALSIFKIRPDRPIHDAAWFAPGQYLVLGLNNEEKPELGSVRRAMSIVSAPQETDAVEFYIRYVSHPDSDNPLTHLLWKAREGDRIFMTSRPAGVFTLAKTVGQDDRRFKICVAAGTGLAPFVSMLRHRLLLDPKADLGDFVVLHGASYQHDLGYREEMERYRSANGLRYYATISRPKESPEWDGITGRVEDFFLPDRLGRLEEKLGLGEGDLTPDRAAVFICGLQGTIGMTIVRLVPRGFIPDNHRIRQALEVPAEAPAAIFFEQYDTTPVIDLKDPAVVDPLRDQWRRAAARNS